MTFMKKHHFLKVDFHSTVKFSPKENTQLNRWLLLASEVISDLMEEKLLPVKFNSLDVSLLICGDARIRNLNRLHRHKDKVTDVLSFPAHDHIRRLKKTNTPSLFLGDLAISAPQARRQAHNFDISFFDEFIHLFFHGILHLMGYDHEVSVKEEKLMESWEKRALDKFSHKKKGSSQPKSQRTSSL
jgi:probable rRNA maturation factor